MQESTGQNNTGQRNIWPDQLQPPDVTHVGSLLDDFWHGLDRLGNLLVERQLILAVQQLATTRRQVIELMLAMNGIAYPTATDNLNSYLGASQRRVLEKSLLLNSVDVEACIGQAVALVVIYRWYAPQIVEAFGCTYPAELEQTVWARLVTQLPDWPRSVTSS